MTSDSGSSLAQVLGEVARSLSSAQGLDDTLTTITSGAVDTVPGADFAGITLVRDKSEVESVAATDDLVVQADKAQEEFHEGPCLSAVWEHETFHIDDMTDEPRCADSVHVPSSSASAACSRSSCSPTSATWGH
ncbi:MAG: hypothetical protein QOD35_866, partial [Nocardioidaceae bacterium]|nr:hypothetical protein [Nocardioidaceae bacterium]